MTRGTRISGVCCALLLAAACFGATPKEAGIAAFHEGRYSAAIEQLRAALVTSPGDAQANVFLALAQAASGDCVMARPVLESAASGADPTLVRLAGLAVCRCQDAPQAFDTLSRLAARFPGDPDVLYAIAKFHMKAFNDATFAMYQKAPASYRVHQLSAEIFEVENQYAEAAAEYRKAIALNASAPNLHYQLGRALLLEGHGPEMLEQARNEFDAELRISPEDGAAEFQIGQIFAAQGNRQAAEPYFRRALRLTPKFPEAEVALGRLLLDDKKPMEAIPLLEHVVSMQADNEPAHYALMRAYRDAGQIEKAKQEKQTLDRLQKPPEGEFTDFLKKLGEKPPQP